MVLGGGYSTNDPLVIIMENLPISDGVGWRVKAIGPEDNWHLRVYAICGSEE